MSKKKQKPRLPPRRVGAPSGAFLQISSEEWQRVRSSDVTLYAESCAFTLSPLEHIVCVRWSSPEHILCDAAMLYPTHIDVLFEAGVVDEAISLADAGALAEFYYACERFDEFDALVIENIRAREHILSLGQPPHLLPTGGAYGAGEMITPAQHRVRAVVAAAAARRAVEEICDEC